jgi:hypothetical protein
VNLATLRILLDSEDKFSAFRIEGDSATYELSTSEGPHVLSVRLADYLGNETIHESEFQCTLPPLPISVTTPVNFATVRTADILVDGVFQGAISQIRVDGIPATVSGQNFQALVPLIDGKNTLLVTGYTDADVQMSATLTVTLDRDKPRIYVTSPYEGQEFYGDSVEVIGSVSDRISDIHGQSMPFVRVNGIEAAVVNHTFRAVLPLVSGENTLTAIATDNAGNFESAVVRVMRETGSIATLAASGGKHQSAVVYQPLASSLQVTALDAAGQPLPGQNILFRVTLGDGTFAAGQRLLQTTTNDQGLAEVAFTLGRRSGPGANEVTAEAIGLAGKPVFHPLALEGPAYRIHPSSGVRQRGIASSPAPQAVVAFVTDSASNPKAGIPVIFTVVRGGGHFSGQNTDTVLSGADGRAAASVNLGPEAGRDNNLVTASFAGNPSQAATFVLSGYAPGPASETRVSGVVLDNSNLPLAGVTVRLEESGQQTVTDSTGYFSIGNVPVGMLHLRIDGTTSTRPGDWVTLMFEVHAISGVDNDIDMPIYLVARNNAEGKEASGSQDQVITLSEIPGFSLRVPAGSAVFPHDADDHLITVTTVHTDKIPMPPGDGLQPRFIVSIGPPDVRFDPPAPITFPNVDGLRPGEQTHFYSFDHDLSAFVSIGTGTVSEDGATVTSDKGYGIVKGGWHGGGPPPPTGDAEPPSLNITPAKLTFKLNDIVTKFVTAIGAPGPGTWNWNFLGSSDLVAAGINFSSATESGASFTPKSGFVGHAQAIVEFLNKNGISVGQKTVDIEICPEENDYELIAEGADDLNFIGGAGEPIIMSGSSYLSLTQKYQQFHPGKTIPPDIKGNVSSDAVAIEGGLCGLKKYSITVNVDYFFTPEVKKSLPIWANYGSAQASDRQKWDAFFSKVDEHENYHVQSVSTILNQKIKDITKYNNAIYIGYSSDEASLKTEIESQVIESIVIYAESINNGWNNVQADDHSVIGDSVSF